jgi:hypothetical protein
MPNNDTALTIDQVAQPWYVRHRNWLIAGAVAGGLVALGRMRSQKNVLANPYRSKHREFWLEPMDIGNSPPAPLGRTTQLLQRWWDRTHVLRPRGTRENEDLAEGMIDAVLQLYLALGRPGTMETSADLAIERAIAQDTGSPGQSYWGRNIVNLRWLFVAAQEDPRLLRWVWYAIHVPAIAKLSPGNQERVFRIIDSLPKKERWRVQWYFASTPSLSGPVDHLPERYSVNQEDNYHHGYLDIASESGYTLGEAVALPYKTFLEKVEIHRVLPAEAKQDLWLEVQEYVPRKQPLLELTSRAIINFPKKEYLRAYRYLKKDNGLHELDRVRAATGLSFTFGADWKKWLDGMAKKGIDAHDATFWLPRQPSPGLGQFLRRRFLPMDELGVRIINQMNLIASAWNELPQSVRRDSTKNIVRYITSAKYENVRSEEFAEEAARWGVDEDDYSALEKRYLAGLASGSTIPSVVIEDFGLRLSKLDRDDPRGLFLGHHTACCQAPGMVGEACAWHGAESPYGGFYVVEDDQGQVIAQSWTWRNHDVVVFDNIEGPGIQSGSTRNKIIQMFHWLAGRLIEEDPSILEVRIGETVDRRSSGTIDWEGVPAGDGDISVIPPPMDFVKRSDDMYTDSSEMQTILAKRGEGTRYFRSAAYMNELAAIMVMIMEDWESPIHGDEDAMNALQQYIAASDFDIDIQIGSSPDDIVWNQHRLDVQVPIDVGLYDPKTRTHSDSVSVPAYATGYFTDFNLRDFNIESERFGNTQAEEDFIRDMMRISGNELEGYEILEDYMDPPPEAYDIFNAPYVVTVNMEEFKGYRDYGDANTVRSMLEGVNDDLNYGSAQIYLLRKLDDDEIEEYEESGQLDDECWELQEGEWWCWEQ